MRTGVRIGIDVGAVRIGVARSDPMGTLAVPVETVRQGAGHLDRIRRIVAEHDAMEVVVGLPLSLDGEERAAARSARNFAVSLADAVEPVPVRLVDERFSTVTAERVLAERGTTGRQRRAVVDQAAAVVILQNALDAERAAGVAPGTILERRDA